MSMPIVALPDFTVRAIGSSLVLNDACSVVKELVDNALDANATSIIVEISLDALDLIQVKDSGHGIGIEDRQLLCKRGCTSKIRTMSDLEKLGGSSLGFRGEALASVAELSEAVVLTTRVDGEIVGTTLKFSRDGTLQNSASASHPVGTSLRIQGFLQALPVRKEAAKKAAPKTLASIRKLLYSYAYARPSIRFAFKVLRARNEKANWNYGPKLGSISLQDATAKIAGQEVAAQCELRSANLPQTISQLTSENVFSVNAVIVRPDAEASKIHNVGHYVSIDGRPVNPARGVIKNIVKLYKSFYRVASCNADRKLSNVDPFLCMHIRCPPQSYDVNIEPAKDDVLFSEPSMAMALAEKLFRDYYGELAFETPTRSRPSAKYQATPTSDDNFDLLLARKASGTAEAWTALRSTLSTQSPVDVPGRTKVSNVAPLGTHLNSCHAPGSIPEPRSSYHLDRSLHEPMHAKDSNDVERPGPYFNMYGADDEDFFKVCSPPLTNGHVSKELEDEELRSARVTNPWSLAKLNASTRPSIGQPSNEADAGLTIQLITPGREQNDASRHLQRQDYPQKSTPPQSSMPSPVASSPTPAAYQNPGPPLRRRAYHERQENGDDAIESTQNFFSDASHARPVSTIDTWAYPLQRTARLPSFKKASVSYGGDDSFGAAGRLGFERQERTLNEYPSTELTDPENPWTEPSRISNHINKPFRSPFKRHNIPSSRPNENLESPDPACTGAIPAAPNAKAPVLLPDQSPSPKRRILITCHEGQSLSMPQPPSPSQRSFKMSQSPNTELAEILEFEQKKKAAVLQHRRSQSKCVLGELDAARLAHVQLRSNDISSVQAVSSQTRRSIPSRDLREEQSNPARNIEVKSANASAEEVGSAIHRNSPHRNRYLTAIGRLDNPGSASDQMQRGGHPDRENCNAGDILDKAGVRLSEDDPRAYLMRNSRSGQNMDGLSGLTKTGLNMRRTKTDRLPLETIPPDAANHCLKAISPHPFPATLALAVITRRRGEYDEYIPCGANSFVRWSANSRDVTAWQATLQKLISKSYKARLAGGEPVAPEITVMLTTAIRAHADAYGV